MRLWRDGHQPPPRHGENNARAPAAARWPWPQKKGPGAAVRDRGPMSIFSPEKEAGFLGRPLDLWPCVDLVHDRDRLREIVTHRDGAIEQRRRVLLEIDHIRAEFLQTIGDIERLGPCVGAFFLKDLHFVRSWPVLNGL